MGKIFYLMGKSASGKDSLYRMIRERTKDRLLPLVLYTTRPIRSGEAEGREYYFTDEAHLAKLRAAGRIIEERCYHTVHGPWYYFTADEGQIDPVRSSYLGIGTLESYVKLKNYFGEEQLVPLYIETEDGLRLFRALERERRQKEPKYAELCRRFLADQEDFSEERLKKAGVSVRYENNGTAEACLEKLLRVIEG